MDQTGSEARMKRKTFPGFLDIGGRLVGRWIFIDLTRFIASPHVPATVLAVVVQK